MTIKQEKYIQCLISGDSQRVAYRKAYPASEKWTDKSVDNKASKLFKKAEIQARLAEVQDKIVKNIEQEGIFNATDVLRNIYDIIIANKEESPQVALKGLELYGKHLKLFTDKVEHSGEIKQQVQIIDDI